MTYEEIKSYVEYEAERLRLSRLMMGRGAKEIEDEAYGLTIGMVKAFKAAGLLTAEQAIDIHLNTIDNVKALLKGGYNNED